jgi:hypothetical protein
MAIQCQYYDLWWSFIVHMTRLYEPSRSQRPKRTHAFNLCSYGAFILEMFGLEMKMKGKNVDELKWVQSKIKWNIVRKLLNTSGSGSLFKEIKFFFIIFFITNPGCYNWYNIYYLKSIHKIIGQYNHRKDISKILGCYNITSLKYLRTRN